MENKDDNPVSERQDTRIRNKKKMEKEEIMRKIR